MPGVQRSHSLRTDYSPVNLRPKVSFNKAVHIKRISRKERLPQVPEDEDSPVYSEKLPMAANGVKGPSKFSTLPSRSARNGVKKTEAPPASERLSRMIRHDVKPEEPPKVERPKKKTLGERMKGIFGKKKTEEDELKSRYTEFKGRNSSSDATDNEAENYSGKRRGSAPETRTSWFRSLERLKKNDLPPTTRDIHRKERYFGESDRESASRRRHNESSAESATEVDGMGPRTPSLVYLHTAAVGDIPHRRSETPTKRLSRSVSVLAPWAPRMRPPRATRSRATQTDFSQAQEEKRPSSKTRVIEVEREPSSVPVRQTSRSLPKLVFTGPSIDDTVGRSATSTIQRSTVHLRSRK
ncbi:muscle M-line assembly protein unc-89 [Halyomorpha halys]|uniref:muscle M-line assembly protein unc-89 n=1 Tax=Halyomorpha halys TaxID=286706 RepID=UPI0006D4D244|nr:uncharacterized protein LOC106682564 [Halyomorpha halys]XP_014278968.1 uncharacterized protein LOC106682564 [Halyomorpha halys]